MSGVEFNVDERGIGLLSIDRPKVRNALNWAAMQACAQAIEAAHRVTELKALIVTGVGKTFVSGGDLSELQHYSSQEDGLRLAQVMGDALARLDALPCPTIAAINGPARGGGAEIAVACDLRVMSEDADLGFVHTRLGIIPAWGGGQRLMRIVGYAHALELIATGRVLSAGEALARGLVNLVSSPGQALSAARELAGQVASLPAAAVQAAKRALRKGLVSGEGEALEAERAEFPPLWDTDFRREAVQRFLNKAKVGLNGRRTEETPIKLRISSPKPSH